MLHRIDEFTGVGLHLDLVLRKIQTAYVRAFAEQGIDITIEQWVILHRIHQLGDAAGQADIVRSNFRNRATTSRVIGGLERKGLLKKGRFAGDRKRFRLQLTPAGHEIVERLLPTARALRARALEGIDPVAFESFLGTLDQIGANYGDASPGPGA